MPSGRQPCPRARRAAPGPGAERQPDRRLLWDAPGRCPLLPPAITGTPAALRWRPGRSSMDPALVRAAAGSCRPTGSALRTALQRGTCDGAAPRNRRGAGELAQAMGQLPAPRPATGSRTEGWTAHLWALWWTYGASAKADPGAGRPETGPAFVTEEPVLERGAPRAHGAEKAGRSAGADGAGAAAQVGRPRSGRRRLQEHQFQSRLLPADGPGKAVETACIGWRPGSASAWPSRGHSGCLGRVTQWMQIRVPEGESGSLRSLCLATTAGLCQGAGPTISVLLCFRWMRTGTKGAGQRGQDLSRGRAAGAREQAGGSQTPGDPGLRWRRARSRPVSTEWSTRRGPWVTEATGRGQPHPRVLGPAQLGRLG